MIEQNCLVREPVYFIGIPEHQKSRYLLDRVLGKDLILWNFVTEPDVDRKSAMEAVHQIQQPKVDLSQ